MDNTFQTNAIIITTYFTMSLVLLVLTIYQPAIFFVSLLILLGSLLYLNFISGRLKLIHYVCILAPSIVLSPFINIPGLMAIKLEDIWLAFGLMVFFTKMIQTKGKLSIDFPVYAKLFLLFIAWIIVTIFISSYREPYYYSHRDWLEVFKNIKLLAILLISYNVKLNSKGLKKAVNILLLSLLASALFGIMQYFNILNINSWLTPYYIFESKLNDLETQSRVVGTFGNPNFFAAALLIGIAFSFSSLFNDFKFRYIVFLLIFFTALIMTLSRTALVTAVLLVIIMFTMIINKTRKRIKSFFMFSFIPFVFLIALKFAPESFFFRMGFLSDLSSDNSFQSRLFLWKEVFESRAKINLFTGTGPVSKLHFHYDNEWLMLLTLYGVIGVFLFMLLFTTIYYNLGKVSNNELSFYNITLKGLILVFAVYMITIPVFQQLQLMPLIILFLGLGLNKAKTYY